MSKNIVQKLSIIICIALVFSLLACANADDYEVQCEEEYGEFEQNDTQLSQPNNENANNRVVRVQPEYIIIRGERFYIARHWAYLDLSNMDLTDEDILPLAELTELWRLNLDGNKLSNLTPLAQITGLRELSANNNQIRDLTPLSGLQELSSLSLNDNQISDVTSLANLRLRRLELNDNQISDLSLFPWISRLSYVSLSGNQISDLSPLAGRTQFNTLKLNRNNISDITPISELTGLWRLELNNNQISDVTALAEVISLGCLSIRNNQIANISSFATLTRLMRLDLRGNKITDITALYNLTQLETLRLANNQIRDVTPLAELENLRHVYLRGNPIENLAPLTNVTRREITENQINELRLFEENIDGAEWMNAYIEFLNRADNLPCYYGDFPWDSGHILYATLVDFERNGIPKLLLVIQQLYKGGDLWEDDLIVVGYIDGKAEIIYHGWIGGEGGWFQFYEIAIAESGQIYLVDIGSIGDYRDVFTIYRTFQDGTFITVLERGTPRGDFHLERQYFYANGQSITEEEFYEAEKALNITERRTLAWNFWTFYDRENIYEFIKTFADWR